MKLPNKTFDEQKIHFLGAAAIFWSFEGQNPKMFKHRFFIYQNVAFGPIISKNLFSLSFEVTLTKNWVIRGHFGSKSVNFPTLVNYIPN